MASLQSFTLNPTKQTNYCNEYNNSFFSLPASPEYTMGEACLASLTRALGSNVEESEVYSKNSIRGSNYRKFIESNCEKFQEDNLLNDEILNYLKSPLAGQSPKNPSEYLNLYPLIPQFSFVSNSARFTGNSWNPSEFIKGMLATGSPSKEAAKTKWNLLYESISVSEADDIWAKLINNMFPLNSGDEKFKWNLRDYDKGGNFDKYRLDINLYSTYSFPAKAFCENIEHIISLKKLTTRRQWISIFESFLRISMGAHLIWICNLNTRLWKLIWDGFDNLVEDYSLEYVSSFLFQDFRSFELDINSDSCFRRICGDYAEARFGINLFVHYFNETYNIKPKSSFGNLNELVIWLNAIRKKSLVHKDRQKLKDQLLELLSKNPKIQQGAGSFSKNMFEFLKHSLGQKATTDPRERNFDQCYWVVKKGRARNAQWVVRLGPVSIITLVALSIKSKAGTASDLTNFLSMLGIVVNPDKILDTTLGVSLVDLGLTNDNPDGEKGIVILNPFYQAQKPYEYI